MYANNSCCSWADFSYALRRCWKLADKINWQRAYVAWRKYSATAGEFAAHCRREHFERLAWTPAPSPALRKE